MCTRTASCARQGSRHQLRETNFDRLASVRRANSHREVAHSPIHSSNHGWNQLSAGRAARGAAASSIQEEPCCSIRSKSVFTPSATEYSCISYTSAALTDNGVLTRLQTGAKPATTTLMSVTRIHSATIQNSVVSRSKSPSVSRSNYYYRNKPLQRTEARRLH